MRADGVNREKGATTITYAGSSRSFSRWQQYRVNRGMHRAEHLRPVRVRNRGRGPIGPDRSRSSERQSPCPDHISTSYVERQNLNLRMGVRRFTRLTNAVSKKLANHVHALYCVRYNWCRRHTTTRVTLAQTAALTDTWRDAAWLVPLLEERTPAPSAKPGPKPRQSN